MGFSKRAVALIWCGLTVGTTAFAQNPDPVGAKNGQIDALIRKLGSSVFTEREKARVGLETIGPAGLDALRLARKQVDVETQRRIADLIQRLEEQLLTQQILAPKEVTLLVKDVSVDEAIAELAKLSGYPLQFQGDRVPLAGKKINLDTGKTTFWKALDQVCDQAGLIERIPANVDRSPTAQDFPKRARVMVPPSAPSAPPGPIVLTNRNQEKLWTSYAGAVKSQLRVSRVAGTRELELHWIVSIEPRLLNGQLVGRPALGRVIDEEQRKLTEILEGAKIQDASLPNGTTIHGSMIAPHGAMHRHTQIRIQEGSATAKNLKELSGNLALQIDLANETIARVPRILEASGKAADGATGGSMKVNNVRKLDNGDVEVQVTLVNLTPNPFGNNIIVNGGNVIIRGNINIQGGIVIGPNGVRIGGPGGRKDLPDLIDAKGQKFQITSTSSNGTQIGNGVVTTSATILYRPNPGQSAANELVLFGIRTHTIAVPFRFENVPVP